MPEDTIVIKAPAGTKARWVRQSQRQGRKLSDWLIDRVEAPMTKMFAITIPADVQIADLQLARDPAGTVSFDWSPIERICAASGIDVSLLREAPEDNLAELLTAWYRHHLEAGGAPILVSSGFRSPAVNALIGGSPTSAHICWIVNGRAVIRSDFERDDA